MQGDVLEIARESRSSIELDRDAKGIYRWSIKLYWDAEHDDEEGLLQQLARLDARLRSLFLSEGS